MNNNEANLPLANVKGLGPARAELLASELQLFTVRDLLGYYPFRYEDRTGFTEIRDVVEEGKSYQLKGMVSNLSIIDSGRVRRLAGRLTDASGFIDLVFFQTVDFWYKKLRTSNGPWLVYGKANEFNGRYSLNHAEMELYNPEMALMEMRLWPVYNTTEMMKRRKFESRPLAKSILALLQSTQLAFTEWMPPWMMAEYDLLEKTEAVKQVHFPADALMMEKARKRLKFEELLNIQLHLLLQKKERRVVDSSIALVRGSLAKTFIDSVFPHLLTSPQRKVLKEIWEDMATLKQMNRLLQGDVGSGKTVVAFISALFLIDSGYQACIMAPTEILAEQHFISISEYTQALGLKCVRLSGSMPRKERTPVLKHIANGEANIIVGTHALIQKEVTYHRLGLAVIDEQHRFGVDQRAAIRAKGVDGRPHVLVMTATPIPRTLSLTLYGDLDVSVIDALPAGRTPIRTIHRYEKDRPKIYEFIRTELMKGRQAYIVYPIIEESEKLDLQNLLDGYETVKRNFPGYEISMVHGKMPWVEREPQMTSFVARQTQIMVATTVIEVGINVPNATVMLVENTERFGLSQLHQLRGRVGRGADQSYCILLSSIKLSTESRTRIKTMVESTDGFFISEVDMQLRGGGNLLGTQQSGTINLALADLATDGELVAQCRQAAETVLINAEEPANKRLLESVVSYGANAQSYLKIG